MSQPSFDVAPPIGVVHLYRSRDFFFFFFTSGMKKRQDKILSSMVIAMKKKVQVGKDQEKAQCRYMYIYEMFIG